MVDVNSQNKTINVNVSSSGASSNVNASGDASQYYAGKAKEWATSNKLVDNEDYSAKYYANTANKSAISAQENKERAEEILNNTQVTGENAINNIDNARNNAVNELETVTASSLAEASEANSLIITNKSNAINEINTTKNNALSAIDTNKTSAVAEVNNAKIGAIEDLNTSKDEALEEIASAGGGNSANKDLSNLTETGENKFVKTADLVEVDFVNKSGDTMTGDLTIQKANGNIVVTGANGYKSFISNNKDLDYTSIDQINMYGSRVISNDKNGTWFAYNQHGVASNGNFYNNACVRRSINGTVKQAVLGITVNKTGYAWAEAPTPATTDNSTKIATTAWVRNYAIGYPDYSAGVSKTWNTDITATKDVLICYGGQSDQVPADSIRLYINNQLIGDYVIANAGKFMQFAYIPSGATYKLTGGRTDQYITEYPLKGKV